MLVFASPPVQPPTDKLGLARRLIDPRPTTPTPVYREASRSTFSIPIATITTVRHLRLLRTPAPSSRLCFTGSLCLRIHGDTKVRLLRQGGSRIALISDRGFALQSHRHTTAANFGSVRSLAP